jgi:hypothetical protein
VISQTEEAESKTIKMTKQEDILKEVLKSDLICSCKSPLHTNQKDREHFVSKISLSFPIKKAISLTAEKKDAEWIVKIKKIDEELRHNVIEFEYEGISYCLKDVKVLHEFIENLLAENKTLQKTKHNIGKINHDSLGEKSSLSQLNKTVENIQEVCKYD